ncbi:MAG: hypothetical protein N4A74_11390 [Carboxylicivirga sp.]|jgi:hypothetical protein|nr:hypothetical protein [Carboxylicivirga sp.]
MNKYYIARNYRSKFDAAGKAKMDCETILANNGWKNIGFKQTWISNAILGTVISAVGITWALIKLKRKSHLCLQYPLNKFYKYIVFFARLKKCKLVTIVHDVYSLRNNPKLTNKEVKLLSKSSTLIVHNSTMRQWFEQNNTSSQLIELNIFDYLHEKVVDIEKTPAKSDNYRVVFAGNMGGNRSFIYELDKLPRGNFEYLLYGVGFHEKSVIDPTNTILTYKGKFPSNEIIDRIDGDFGLVWYGKSLDSCDGMTGQYLQYNNPHKLSLYIQCEMPIIIWDKAGMAKFVEENKIGITVSSLKDIKGKLEQLTIDDYNELKTNILKVKQKISEGTYLQNALKKII